MRDILRLVCTLTLIACIAGAVLSLVEVATREPIAAQRRLVMLRALQAVLPAFDNQPDNDTVTLGRGRDKRGRELRQTFFRARSDGKLVGIAFSATAPDGYSGNIDIMVGITPDGTVQAIEILAHMETPGLGDKITHQPFKQQFHDKSLDNADWRVKKDGGGFDQITGATISPRAVVGAVRKALEFYHRNSAAITAPEPAETPPTGGGE
ncbi:MAG: RnfABCDGE type electron transport complex subunit G [Desulfuromonadales bacterium]|nr:RnfABCDGE type electron transport complex subunit G [Desulfuromonadales bacterium]MDT8422455.1 RnfABCDGE type electron transport complex subunit G [Desulfuromonadales bacterium]